MACDCALISLLLEHDYQSAFLNQTLLQYKNLYPSKSKGYKRNIFLETSDVSSIYYSVPRQTWPLTNSGPRPAFDAGCLSGFEPELRVPQTLVLTITL